MDTTTTVMNFVLFQCVLNPKMWFIFRGEYDNPEGAGTIMGTLPYVEAMSLIQAQCAVFGTHAKVDVRSEKNRDPGHIRLIGPNDYHSEALGLINEMESMIEARLPH